ncbi:MAG: serine/threonine-protein kinase, partial [Nannocystaceae bacterium]
MTKSRPPPPGAPSDEASGSSPAVPSEAVESSPGLETATVGPPVPRAEVDVAGGAGTLGTLASDEPSVPLPTGTTISRYVVLDEIGRGGMGRVLRAYDPRLQREVALKEVRPDLLDEAATRRQEAEARAMAMLSHPNVVAVFDVTSWETGAVVLVMEYVPGQTLKQWLRERERPWPEIVERFVAAGRGLQAAHDAGLLHRDFKPSNVLVSEDGAVKVTDFGLATVDAGASEHRGSIEEILHGEPAGVRVVRGTLRYMAPEHHAGKVLTPAADQYAFCVALW